MMVIPLYKIALPFKGHKEDRVVSIPTPSWFRNSDIHGAGKRECLYRALIKTKLISKKRSSFIVSAVESKSNEESDDERVMAAEKCERKLADVWKEIHGQNAWAGMLDPIDPLLRAELMRYGDMAQACYDAYDDDPYSKYCGSCKIKPSMFFESLGERDCGYEVTSYLYSLYNANFLNFYRKSLRPDGWSSSANWIGYVAVSNDECSRYIGRRDITIAWRGTNTDGIEDLMNFQNPTTYHKILSRDSTIKVEEGFLNIYTDRALDCPICKYSAREQVLSEVKRLKELYPHEQLSITIVGHSLGSALAILSAYDIAEIGMDVTDDGHIIPISVFSFSGPRVGNDRFRERLEGLGVKVLRVFNIHDRVPQVPGIIFNEDMPKVLQESGVLSPWSYFHVGVKLALDHKNSPCLKETSNLAYNHNLEVLLHLLDGYHGKGSRFRLTSERDIALVNKTTDFLEDHFHVPPNWWQTKNRGLIQNPLGQWVMPERYDFEAHLPPENILHRLQHFVLDMMNYTSSIKK